MGSKVNKIMNKVSDKLVPKELAPFLPIAAAFIPGGGIMQQYLLPQLLQGLSSAKMTGEVDAKAQALQLGMSALKGAQQQTRAEKALLEQNPELAKQVNKANTLADATEITDKARLKELAQAGDIEGLGVLEDYGTLTGGGDPAPFKIPFTDKTFGDFLGGPFQPGDTFGTDKILSFTDDAGNTRFFDPGSSALENFLATETTTPLDLSKLTGQEFKDTIVGAGNITDVGFDKKLKALQGTQGIGSQQGLQALNKARGFFNSPIGFNKATAFKAGLGATPYLMNEAQIAAKKIEEENAAAEAANQSYRDASSALSNFFVNRDPNYNMLYGYNQGGRVGLDEGGFLSNILGDSTVDNMQRGLLGIMGATDSMMGMGMSEYDDAFKEMIDAGISEEDIIEMIGPRPGFTMQANGGRVNKNMGGIMNVGSIPQTPMVPQGMQLNGRGGGFIPMGAQEKKDDVPAMLAKNEFVMTSDAVRAAGGGSIEKGAQKMYDLMNSLEAQV